MDPCQSRKSILQNGTSVKRQKNCGVKKHIGREIKVFPIQNKHFLDS